ncbi:MAG TPA: GspH/FimT family pseudopilin [Gemmatimonadales bacterium]|nr:GspH/FimT family pseudopilin [Gemmatimonadales bacterium]
MRQGFSLLETVLVLAVMGLLCGLALPHLAGVLDTVSVDAAANHLVAAHQRARLMAVARSQVTVLTVDADRLSIRHRGEDTVLWSENGPSAQGVDLAGSVTRQLTFSPEGFTLGLSNATLDLSRGRAHRRVVVSRVGRVRILR